MINEAQISLAGFVATQPVTKMVKDGVTNLSMRVAWTPRWQDRVTGEWVDGGTSYVTVICWRKLADNAGICLRKGDPVVVKGRLTVRTYEKDGVTRNAVEVEASAVGHDLSHGIARFQRVRPQTGMSASEYAASSAAGDGHGGDGQGGDGHGGAGPGGAGQESEGSAAAAGAAGAAGADETGEPFFDEDAIGGLAGEEDKVPASF